MTHLELSIAAARWFVNGKFHCKFAVAEANVELPERPDVFGWRSPMQTFLAEVKMSRSDFLRDKKKRCRRRNASSGRSSFGSWRYYIAPKDILTLDDIPKAWGFIEYCNSRFYLRRESDLFERSQIYEYQYVSELLVRSEFLHDRLFHSYDRKGLRKVKISNKL